ncbi:MAG: transcription termination/antitermination protein NusA [Alphaproteobacteria bacterium]|nr:transcription termination/antitermination protein NusA [Alphaproteobacteria bacterium]
MAQAATIENREILQIADAVAREKGIDREAVLDAMENAVQVAGRRKYGHELDIRSEIDRKTGAMHLFRQLEVVDVVEDSATQITVAQAKAMGQADAEVGQVLLDPLPPIDFGRIAAQTAKQVIIQKVRDAERDQQFEEFKNRKGDLIYGVVKRVEFGNVVVDLGAAEAIIQRNESIPRENFKQGDRIRAYILDVRREKSGPQIFLSRTHPMFLAKLFAQEVPEIYDGIIEIKAVARDPGSRAKICVISHDSNIDPVGSCVGVRGSRVQAVINELQGERIDIIPWTENVAQLIISSLQPAEVSKVVVNEAAHRLDVVVAEEQLSLAIGRRGQNVRLASQISGWNVDIMTEDQESTRRADEFNNASRLLIEALNVEDVIGELLASEGFVSVEEVAYIDLEDLADIEGFDMDVATELQKRARDFLEEKEQAFKKKCEELGISDEMLEFPHMTQEILMALVEGGIKSRDDLADLARDEFRELVPAAGLSDAQIDEIIMAARAHWFEGDEAAQDGGATA